MNAPAPGDGAGKALAALDDPGRISEIRAAIARKRSLQRFYERNYQRYGEALARCPQAGIALELGSGGGFAKEAIPGLITSDVLPYYGIDMVVDGTHLPFRSETLRFIGMTNVFHHVPDVELFFAEAERCLEPGGRVLIIDQHVGLISRLILGYLHHEPYDPDAAEWRFRSDGPLSGANGALAWIVFVRDRQRFSRLFPRLAVAAYRPHTPLSYWLAGGLKRWNLVPGWATGAADALDAVLLRCSEELGSFADVELIKV
jgi:SAM-dependent methyltransferase